MEQIQFSGFKPSSSFKKEFLNLVNEIKSTSQTSETDIKISISRNGGMFRGVARLSLKGQEMIASASGTQLTSLKERLKQKLKERVVTPIKTF